MDKRKKNVGGRPRTTGLSHNKKAKTYRSGLSLATSDNKSTKITTFFKRGQNEAVESNPEQSSSASEFFNIMPRTFFNSQFQCQCIFVKHNINSRSCLKKQNIEWSLHWFKLVILLQELKAEIHGMILVVRPKLYDSP